MRHPVAIVGTALALLAGLVVPVGCSDHTRGIDVSDGASAEDPQDSKDLEETCYLDPLWPQMDDDGDGLTNATEDPNLNCTWEPELGETNPKDSDSDGDGCTDGEEISGFEGWPRTDPNNPDTDDDGVLDCQSPADPSCAIVHRSEVAPTHIPEASSTVVLPPGYRVVHHESVPAASYANAQGTVFGFVAELPLGVEAAADESPLSLQVGMYLLGVARGEVTREGNLPTVAYSGLSDQDRCLPEPPAVTGFWMLTFEYGVEGGWYYSPKDPAELRDQIITEMTAVPTASGQTGEPCGSISGMWRSVLRTDGSVVTMASFACEELWENDATVSIELLDVLEGTILAPERYRPFISGCEELEPPPPPVLVDWVWVVDNSSSMADHRDYVEGCIEGLLDTWPTDDDVRFAVTTTETYLLDQEDGAATLMHDELLDFPTGLRGEGFIPLVDDAAKERVLHLVTYDEGCEVRLGREPLAPPGANICGYPYEDGLESALVVAERVSTDPRAEYRWREGATRTMAFFTDEESQSVALPGDPESFWPPESSEFQAILRRLAARFEALDVWPSVAVTGTRPCEPLPPPGGSVYGGQPGHAYIDLVNDAGGGEASICGGWRCEFPDYSQPFPGGWELVGCPLVPSIRVEIDGELIPRYSRRGGHNGGWAYDTELRRLFLYGEEVQPTHESTISVAYWMWAADE